MDRTIHKSGLARLAGLARGLVKNELLLLRPFVKEPWREFTITEIKRITENRSHHYVFDALKKFASLGILEEKRKGNTNTYFINYENGSNIIYLAFLESLAAKERSDLPVKNIARIMEKIKSPFFSLIVGGSYAEGKQKPASDVDVAIIIPDGEPKTEYEIALKEGELMIPETHGFVFTREEFYLMLTNGGFNYGKELARKHVIIYGAEPYYRILFEAMRHGFKG
jgi:predicted nucleotidyltransferase